MCTDNDSSVRYQVEWVSLPMNFPLVVSATTPTTTVGNAAAAATMATTLGKKPGHVSIHFQYTAGIGSLALCTKQD
jgi:hypothetical protein